MSEQNKQGTPPVVPEWFKQARIDMRNFGIAQDIGTFRRISDVVELMKAIDAGDMPAFAALCRPALVLDIAAQLRQQCREYNLADPDRKTLLPPLEYTNDEGVTWHPCEAIGKCADVEMIPCSFGPGKGYKFVHPQCLRYADTKQLVYNNGEWPARLQNSRGEQIRCLPAEVEVVVELARVALLARSGSPSIKSQSERTTAIEAFGTACKPELIRAWCQQVLQITPADATPSKPSTPSRPR